MNAVSLNNLWSYLQGLSLSASNQRWLGERLIEASATHATAISEEELKLKKLNALFGVWNGQEGEQIEAAVRNARVADYERELVSMDDRTRNALFALWRPELASQSVEEDGVDYAPPA